MMTSTDSDTTSTVMESTTSAVMENTTSTVMENTSTAMDPFDVSYAMYMRASGLALAFIGTQF